AEVPRAQPGRERLAVHARQLALQPHLQILRRSRRPLLCGMEQARRSALAHHVHRTAPMGPRVLINGIWYTSPANGVQDLRGGTDVGIWNRSRTSRRSPVRTNCSWTTNGHPALSPTRSTRVAGESR